MIQKGIGWPIQMGEKIHHLILGVNPGIGATGGDEASRATGERFDGATQNTGYRAAVLLLLVAGKGGPIIGNAKHNILHRPSRDAFRKRY